MSFADLYDGKIKSIKIGVNLNNISESENRSLSSGIYEMTHEECVKIVKDINQNNPRHLAITIYEMGMENRWFRLHPAVLKWVESKAPLMVCDFNI